MNKFGFDADNIDKSQDSVGYKLRQHFKHKGLDCLIIGDEAIEQVRSGSAENCPSNVKINAQRRHLDPLSP
ncbi:hypothetical protein [Shewanella benthica]|uniref:Uncharacterized protein n=1 Tax=Shewanella benthica KT99 TaxID=314608 RepID=A9D208_9GAMM|nr:hypothetical protein [Shewanella benthica]EDQ01745.1 hypothetical protein KT99_04059 [Shewanella benthica KT99]